MTSHMDSSESDDVREHLNRILASDEFKKAPQLQNFLRFVVEETLAGNGDRLNAYTIATMALGRGQDFDSETDSIVRSLAVRLRKSLDLYYMNEGCTDAYRLSIPKGGYSIRVDVNSSPNSVTSFKLFPIHAGLPQALIILIAILSVFAIIYVGHDGWHRFAHFRSTADGVGFAKPIIEINKFQPGTGWQSAASFEASGLGAALAAEISDKFFKFRRIRVHIKPRNYESTAEASRNIPPASLFFLNGLINRSHQMFRINVQLIHAATNEKVWSENIDVEFGEELTLQQKESLASQIVTAIVQPDGVWDRFSEQYLSKPKPGMRSAESCIRRAFGYWRNLSRKDLLSLQRCLDKATAGNYAKDASAWAALSLTYVDLHRATIRAAKGNLDDLLASAANAANKAYRLDPNSEAALRSLYTVSFVRGDIGRFKKIGQLAIAKNPLNANTLADFGRKLAYSGEWAKGVALTKKAQQLHPNSPDWYKLVLIHDFYRRREHREALELALSLKMGKSCGTHFTRALNYVALGETANAKRAIARLTEVYPNFASQALELFKLWNFEDEMIARFRVDMAKAGMVLSNPV